MLYKLQNDDYQVAVKTEGAELTSFRHQGNNLEYIWQGDPAFWPRHAPVLFPVVGKLPGGTYSYQGHSYALPGHGFARDENFVLVSQTDHTLTFALTSSAKTLALYPFPFRLEISYALQGNSLETLYLVRNTGTADMYFSIGGHPAVNCPLLPGETFSDYYLEFEKPETLSCYLLDAGLRNGLTQPLLQDTQRLPLHYDLFKNDALVFEGMSSQKISLKTPNHAHGLDFEFRDYPYFGIWTQGPGAKFVCLEPWHGVASRVNDGGELTEKEGIRRLAPGQHFSCAYTITVY